MAMIYRGDYWQVAYLDPERAQSPRRIRWRRSRSVWCPCDPSCANTSTIYTRWDDTSQLDVRVDRLKTWWRTGLLCIGDAAHAMSPVGGVGINLAVADAVAAANILCDPLREGR